MNIAQLLVLITEVTGVQAYIAGGAARNAHFLPNTTPKDVDIFVPWGTSPVREAALPTITMLLSAKLGLVSKPETMNEAYDTAESDFNERIAALIKYRLEDGTDVDVLFSKEDTIKKVLLTFDSSANMAYIRGDSVLWPWGVPEVLSLRKTVSAFREARLRLIAYEIGLPVHEQSFQLHQTVEDFGL